MTLENKINSILEKGYIRDVNTQKEVLDLFIVIQEESYNLATKNILALIKRRLPLKYEDILLSNDRYYGYNQCLLEVKNLLREIKLNIK